MVAATRIKSARLTPDDRAQKVFLLYLDRLLDLIDGAMTLVPRDDATPSIVLMRSALECYVDLFNLARDGDPYLLILQAMLLENRSAIFHYKTEPYYGHFVAELGEAGALKRGKEIAARFKACLKEATAHYPLLRYSGRNLTVLNRFRIADMEERYHTDYTWLSMQTHNALEPIINEERLRVFGGDMLEDAQDGITISTVLHFAMGFMVDALKCIDTMFGPDDDFTREFLALLKRVDDANGGRR